MAAEPEDEKWYQGTFQIPMTEQMFSIITDLFYYINFNDKDRPSVSVSSSLFTEKSGLNKGPEKDLIEPILEEFVENGYVVKREIGHPKKVAFYCISEKGVNTLFNDFRRRRDATLARAVWIYRNGMPNTIDIDGIKIYDEDLFQLLK